MQIDIHDHTTARLIREAQAAILREVRPWLAHARTCKAWLYPGVGVCGCGLDAKLAALREGVE